MHEESTVTKSMILSAGGLLVAAGLKAPSDVLLVGGALSGTTYALGNSQLPRSRIAAYLAGLESLNCAEATIAPLRAADLPSIKISLAIVISRKEDLVRELGIVQTIYDQAPVAASIAQPPLKAARDTVERASSAIAGTEQFLGKSITAAAMLYSQVERIDQSVTEAIVKGTPDLNQIRMTATGLNGSIAGIITNASTGIKKLSLPIPPAVAQSKAGPTDLEKALNSLFTAHENLRQALSDLNSKLPSSFDSLDPQTIERCGLPTIPPPLQLGTQEIWVFSGEIQVRTIEINGGKKEYVVDNPNPVSGIVVTQPGLNGGSVTVNIEKTVSPGRYEIRIHDQAGSSAILAINVSAPSKTGSTSATSDKKTTSNRKNQKNEGIEKSPKPANTPAVPDSSTPNKANGATNPKPPAEYERILALKSLYIGIKEYRIVAADPNAATRTINVSVCGSPDVSTREAFTKLITEKVEAKWKIIVDSTPAC